jgi:PAS domain-containing protein
LLFTLVGDDTLIPHHHFNPQTLILLFGGGVLVVCVLSIGVYLLQKSLGLGPKSDSDKPGKVRVDDEAAFTLATVKGVLTQLKAEQKSAQEKLVEAERRADENHRRFEVLASEFEHGLMVFDAQGFISFSNPSVRRMLAVDTWSRRRYPEIFQDLPSLLEIIGASFETGNAVRKRTVEVLGVDGSGRLVDVSVFPTRDRSGAMEFVACVFRAVTPTT